MKTDKNRKYIEIAKSAVKFVGGNPDKTYVHIVFEEGVLAANVFYQVLGKVYSRSEIGDSFSELDTSDSVQIKLLRGISDIYSDLDDELSENGEETPTEVKIIYSKDETEPEIHESFDLQFSNTEDVLPEDIFKQWYSEVEEYLYKEIG